MSSKKQDTNSYKSDKPLILRIIVLAVAAVMVLGIVVGTVMGSM